MKKALLAVVVFLLPLIASAQESRSVVLTEGLALKSFDVFRRSMFTPDPVEAMIVKGEWEIPDAGDSVAYGKSYSKWNRVSANKEGWFEGQNLRGGYLSIVYNSPKKQKVLLAGFGHSMVYVNGALHYGNRYGQKEVYESWEPRFDYSLIPVELNKGKNEFLFVTAGKMKAKLILSGEGIFFNTKDATLPDIIAGEEYSGLGAVVLINAEDKELKGASVITSIGGKNETIECSSVPPMSVRKIPFKIVHSNSGLKGNIEAGLKIVSKDGNRVLAEGKVTLRILNKGDNHKVTFVSGIDGSVQYYSVNPARNDDGTPKALFLSVHGASVEAINQSGSYYPKTWGHIVSPTNRRPYGFNWEDWGRIDAMEVYNKALNSLKIDPERIYLTGHSMGGHGTWHLGATYPDKFAALGPSAGWISFWSYRVRERNENPSPMEGMIMRATGPSDTYGLSENYKQQGIYIIHGSKDDNVPPTESRNMVENLKKFHSDFYYHEQPEAGHWWDNSDEEGADCVDWAPLFDFFARHSLPNSSIVRKVSFITANPGVSYKNHWLMIFQQIEQLKLSKGEFTFDPGKNRFTGKTENVKKLGLICDMADLKRTVTIYIDDQELSINLTAPPFLLKYDWKGYSLGMEKNVANGILLVKKDGKWAISDNINTEEKHPGRYGTFKSAINNNVIFVYGTRGTKKENEWAFNKSRYDAEQFWYQGNGSVKVIKDTDLNQTGIEDANYIIYGNAATNSAWKLLLEESPVQVNKGIVTIQGKEYKGDDLGCLFVRPMKGKENRTVGVVAGSGLTGMKLTDRRLYMQPGYAFPDLMLFNEGTLTSGIDGVLASGFFGLDWSVDKGEIIYK